MGNDAELLRHDIRVLQRLLAASQERAQEAGDPEGHESALIQAYADVLSERLERLEQLEQERRP